MDTTQDAQAIKADLKALLERLTSESAAASTALGTQLKERGEGTASLTVNLAEAEADIDALIEEGGKELDVLIAEEQKEV